MFLVKAALKNPHAIVVLCLIVAILGLVSLSRTPVDVFPDLHMPACIVAVGYRGMPAEDMEQSIVRRLERMFMQADGVDHMESRSVVGLGLIRVYFRPEIDVNAGISQIISLAIADLRYLPPGTLPPLVLRFDASSMPVCELTLASESLSLTQLFDIANYTIRQQLGNVAGVSAPPVFGGMIRQIMVYVDPDKLQSYGLSPMDVVKSMETSNLVIPTGEAAIGNTNYSVESNSQLPSAAAFNDIPIRTARSGATVFLKDVARAEDSHAILSNIVRIDGRESVYIPIMKQGGANTIRVVEGVKEAMRDFTGVPKEVKLGLVFDQSIYIRGAIDNLAHEGALGAILAGVMVLLFLGSLRSSVAILVSIPLSVVAAFAGLYFGGETVNLMTLGGLALAVGRVVDDAIVVLENIERHLLMGKPPREAARDGAGEVAVPVLISTVTTVLVFLPVVFLTGVGKSLFTPLAKAVGLAMGASYLFAMTFIPIYCAFFLRAGAARHEAGKEAQHEHGSWFGRLFDRFAERYAAALRGAIAHRRLMLGGIGAAFVLVVGLLGPRLGQEFFPMVDAGQFVLNVRAPEGSRVEETTRIVADIERIIRACVPAKPVDELDTLVSNVGIFRGPQAMYSPNAAEHEGFIQVKLRDDHATPTREVMDAVRRRLQAEHPEVAFFFQAGGVVSAALDFGLPAPIDVQVMDEDLEEGRAVAERIKTVIESVPGASDTLIAQSLSQPTLHIDVDRVKAAELGLTQSDVEKNAIVALNSSYNLNPVIWLDPQSGNDYFVAAQYDERRITSLEALRTIPITGQRVVVQTPGAGGPGGAQLAPATTQLRNVAAIRRTNSLVIATHYNIQRTTDVFTTPSGRDIGSLAREIEARIDAMRAELPERCRVRLLGEVASMRESFASFGGAIALAIVLVYLVLVAQFQAVVDPLIIMAAVPLGFIGVVLVLFATGTTLNVQTFLGVMMLVGIVVSNSILLVEFAGRKSAEGLGPVDAAVAAGRIRMRPILMTSIATVLGLLPMAFNIGTGGEANVPLARAVIGGLCVSTLLTLFLVPALYAMTRRTPPAAGPGAPS
jgi:multidrug efflux pump subunit AcrB